jgi:3-hydroxyacyl-CoA dehydrogenase / enoyl-CoA hydratase / 3-hydroxybutyryl-CoA epimerase
MDNQRYAAQVGSLRQGEDGVALLILQMEGKANKINETFIRGFAELVEEALALPGLKGLVITSAHKDFCVGADLDMIFAERDPARLLEGVRALTGTFRKLELGPVPVAAALVGSALGGGYELALACHHRVVLEEAGLSLGLPEVQLGVIPGGGGTQRLPRLIGVQAALEAMAQGKTVRGNKAVSGGWAEEGAASREEVEEKARHWCLSHPGARQPWDRDAPLPDVQVGSEMFRNLFMGAAAFLYKKTSGAYRAPEALLAVVQEGLRLKFDRAMEIEARAFVKLATGDQAKDMIRTLWFHKSAAERHADLPALARGEEAGIRKVAILGAGMMGAGLAFLCAEKGYERGMAHVAGQVARLKWLDEAGRAAVLGRVQGTLGLEELRGADLVIEAVFESVEIKHKVTREVEPLLAEGGIWASNTSALPITDLAEVSARPERFIGLHFFSPVEQMPLIEIILGKARGDRPGTDERTLARCLSFARRIGKTPIVVSDSYAFYTSRVFAAYIMEGVALLGEGQDPRLIEWAARTAGMAVPPLQVFDEVSLSLGRHVLEEAERYTGRVLPVASGLIKAMVDQAGRPGRAGGAGFYDYAEGRRRGLWSGLRSLAAEVRGAPPAAPLSVEQLARAVEEGVILRPRDAEVGAIFGIGFAPNTGGPLAWMDRQGAAALVAELEGLSATAGERFAPPSLLRGMAASGERFFTT